MFKLLNLETNHLVTDNVPHEEKNVVAPEGQENPATLKITSYSPKVRITPKPSGEKNDESATKDVLKKVTKKLLYGEITIRPTKITQDVGSVPAGNLEPIIVPKTAPLLYEKHHLRTSATNERPLKLEGQKKITNTLIYWPTTVDLSTAYHGTTIPWQDFYKKGEITQKLTSMSQTSPYRPSQYQNIITRKLTWPNILLTTRVPSVSSTSYWKHLVTKPSLGVTRFNQRITANTSRTTEGITRKPHTVSIMIKHNMTDAATTSLPIIIKHLSPASWVNRINNFTTSRQPTASASREGLSAVTGKKQDKKPTAFFTKRPYTQTGRSTVLFSSVKKSVFKETEQSDKHGKFTVFTMTQPKSTDAYVLSSRYKTTPLIFTSTERYPNTNTGYVSKKENDLKDTKEANTDKKQGEVLKDTSTEGTSQATSRFEDENLQSNIKQTTTDTFSKGKTWLDYPGGKQMQTSQSTAFNINSLMNETKSSAIIDEISSGTSQLPKITLPERKESTFAELRKRSKSWALPDDAVSITEKNLISTFVTKKSEKEERETWQETITSPLDSFVDAPIISRLSVSLKVQKAKKQDQIPRPPVAFIESTIQKYKEDIAPDKKVPGMLFLCLLVVQK